MSRIIYKQRSAINANESLNKQGKSEANALLREILREALKRRALTIHIDPKATTSEVRFRIDGRLKKIKTFSKHLHQPLLAELQKEADTATDNFDQPSSFSMTVARQPIGIRLSYLPTVMGQKVVIELSRGLQNIDLRDIGLWGTSLSELGRMLASPRGIIIIASNQASELERVSGAIISLVSNSGLSATELKSSLNDPLQQLKLSLLSDPQLLITEAFGSKPFTDVLLKQAKQRLVIITMLTPSSSLALNELLVFANDHFELSKLLLGQVYLASEAKLCPYCRQHFDISSTQAAIIAKNFPDIGLSLGEFRQSYQLPAKPVGCYSLNSKGCKKCQAMGSIGSLSVVDVKPSTARLKSLLTNGADSGSISQLLDKDSESALNEDRLIKALEGFLDWHSLAA